jgi:DNA-binding NarL/FixJ family response regulator
VSFLNLFVFIFQAIRLGIAGNIQLSTKVQELLKVIHPLIAGIIAFPIAVASFLDIQFKTGNAVAAGSCIIKLPPDVTANESSLISTLQYFISSNFPLASRRCCNPHSRRE